MLGFIIILAAIILGNYFSRRTGREEGRQEGWAEGWKAAAEIKTTVAYNQGVIAMKDWLLTEFARHDKLQHLMLHMNEYHGTSYVTEDFKNFYMNETGVDDIVAAHRALHVDKMLAEHRDGQDVDSHREDDLSHA
jgi:hypothetical protein